MNLGLKKVVESEIKAIRDPIESFFKEMVKNNKTCSIFHGFDFDKHFRIFDEIAEIEDVDIAVTAVGDDSDIVSVEIKVKYFDVGQANFTGRRI